MSFKGTLVDSLGEEHKGHGLSIHYDFNTLENTPKARIYYQIDDLRNVDASHVDIHLLNNKFTLKSSYQGPAQDKFSYLNIDIYSSNEDDHGTWRGIFTAEDNQAFAYRDHLSRRTVSVNVIEDKSEKAVKIHTSEIAARDYFLKHQPGRQWQVIVDPAKRHPYAYGGPDVCLWRRGADDKIIVAFVDNKMSDSTRNIGMWSVQGLTKDFSRWRQFVKDRVDESALNNVLKNEIIQAIDNNQYSGHFYGAITP